MDPRVVAVLRLLAEHAEVVDLRPDEGILAIRHGDSVARLHFDEQELLAFIDTAGESATEVWGERLSDEEGAARFLSIYLAESIATREPHESGWWTFRGGGFDPIPPWEAHAHRRQEP